MQQGPGRQDRLGAWISAHPWRYSAGALPLFAILLAALLLPTHIASGGHITDPSIWRDIIGSIVGFAIFLAVCSTVITVLSRRQKAKAPSA